MSEVNHSIGNTLAQIIEPLRLETYGRERVYFGLGDYQGRRLIIQFPVYLSEIPTLVPAVNRPVIAAHVQEIKDYILRRLQSGKAWILGSLTVNVNSNDISYQSFGSNLYIVRIKNGALLRITDGQHRIQAITELMKVDEYRKSLNNDQIPLTLVLDNNAKQADLDFRDMAQSLPLPPVLLVGFSCEGRDGIARSLLEKVPLFRYTEISKSIPGTGTKNIYTINYIAEFVGASISGNAVGKLLEYDTQELIEKVAIELSEKLNDFFLCCPDTAPLVAADELTVADVAQFKGNSILALSLGLEVLGHLFHRSNATPQQLATQINWSKNGELWREFVVKNKFNFNKVKVKTTGADTASRLAEAAIAQLSGI